MMDAQDVRFISIPCFILLKTIFSFCYPRLTYIFVWESKKLYHCELLHSIDFVFFVSTNQHMLRHLYWFWPFYFFCSYGQVKFWQYLPTLEAWYCINLTVYQNPPNYLYERPCSWLFSLKLLSFFRWIILHMLEETTTIHRLGCELNAHAMTVKLEFLFTRKHACVSAYFHFDVRLTYETTIECCFSWMK